MKKILNRQTFYNFYFHLLIAISIIVVSVFGLFYYDFYQVAQSESGVLFYPSYTFDNNISTWNSYFFGTRASSMLSYVTFIFAYFTFPGIENHFMVQFLYYLSLCLLSFWGFYLLLNYLNPDSENKKLKLYLSLLGIFNPSSLSVLARFQYPYIAFIFLLPLILFLTLKTFDSKNIKSFLKWFLLLNLIISFFSIIYASIVSLIMLILVWCLIAGLYLVKSFRFKTLLKIITFFSLWFLINIFWIGPFIIENFSKNLLSSSEVVLNEQSNISTLQFFSNRDSGFLNIFSLLNQEYLDLFFQENFTFQILFRLINLLPILIISIVAFTLFRNRINTKKIFDSKIVIILILFLVFLFLVRGVNFPFGSIYLFIFSKIDILQIFRNNFEKGMLLFYLPYLLFFGLSILYLTKNIKYKKIVYIILVLYLAANSYLFLSSKLFLGTSYPFNSSSQGYRISVPDYYLESSNIINSEENYRDLNTLVLPIVNEGITYDWQYGYIGVDIIHQILSRNTYSFIIPDRYSERVNIIKNIPFILDKQSGLDLFNFKFLVYRNDYKFEERNQPNPNFIKDMHLNNFIPDLEGITPISKFNLNINNKKEYNLNKGRNIEIEDGYVEFYNDYDSSLHLRVTPDASSLFPSNKPYFVVIQSEDIKKIEEFENYSNKKDVSQNKIYKNNSICENCFITDIIYNHSSKPTTSIMFKIFISNPSSKVRIDSISLGLLKESGLSIPNTQIFNSDRVQLYKNQSELSLISCYSNYELIPNISKFIYQEFDPINKLYIKESDFNQSIKDKKLDGCSLSYNRVSNGEYEIKILPKDPKGNYNTILNFNQSADSLWKLVSLEEDLFGKTEFSSDENHFVSNLYSNSFYLENIPSEGKKFRLIYLPEFYFKIFSYVSLISWLVILSIYIGLLVKKTKDK